MNSKRKHLTTSGLAWASALAFGGSIFLTGCGAGGDSLGAGETAGSTHQLLSVTNGSGQLLPHQTYRLTTLSSPGGPVTMDIRTQDNLIENVRQGNPVHPIPSFPSGALLPNGEPGNHFMVARFSSPLDINSFLSSSPALAQNNSLSGSLFVKAVNPISGTATVIPGRVFLNGQTYGVTPSGAPAALPLQTWFDENGFPVPVDTNGDGNTDSSPGIGFPGTQSAFAGSDGLHSPDTIVFVVDSDGDLSTHETFPSNLQISMEIKVSLTDIQGRPLKDPAYVSATVGLDGIPPEVRSTPPPVVKPLMTPAFMEQDVDPLTTLTVEFSEPVQPLSVGNLLSTPVAGLSSSIAISFGPPASVVEVPFHARPLSVLDLSRWELLPSFNFPGSGPDIANCGVFSRVDVLFRAGNLEDLSGVTNTLPLNSYFETGEGPGIVNLPVTPDTIYVGRSGSEPGISVIDLHGFGAGTGNPTYDESDRMVKGNTHYPDNPNVALNGTSLRPPLSPGACTVNGGSAGVFTLSLDSALNDKVVRTPILQSVGDMMLGAALDATFNNSPAPYGCQGSGGNLCAADGFKQVVTSLIGNSVTPTDASSGGGTSLFIDGGPNIASWAPHPNPPPLIYPPLCVSPFIGGQEPTSIDSTLPPVNLQNLLLPGGNPLGNALTGTPPSNLLARESNVYFQGPSLPQVQILNCVKYGLRQQIGHFLYVIDRGRNEIVVLNSNRMTVIDRILVPDPTSLAMGSNLDVLAVSSQSSDSVIFIDIEPESASFHEIIKAIPVGNAPRGIAWEGGNEDILVCNEGTDSVSIISAFSLEVRRTLTSGLNRPFEICMTPRQLGFSLRRNVYFAYILGRNGRVSVFESGPNGVNGWGFDDIIGQIPINFLNPKTIQVDPGDIRSAFWVVHEGQLDQQTFAQIGPATAGALTAVAIQSGSVGQIPVSSQAPQIRDIGYGIKVSIGEERLTGVPVELAFDNQVNAAALPNFFTIFSAGAAATLNGKAIVRGSVGGGVSGISTSQPSYLFAAVPNANSGAGGVDVIEMATGGYLRFDTDPYEAGVQSISAPGTTILMDYFRQ